MTKLKKSSLLTDPVVCVILPVDSFNKQVFSLVKKLKNKKICYVSLNKGADVVQESLKRKKINLTNFSFVDCVTKSITTPKPNPRCMYVSSLNALTELSLTLNKCIHGDASVILVDSLSTFMIYHKPDVINHFFHDLSNKIRAKKGKTLVLLISSAEKKSEVLKKIEVLVDAVVEVK